MTRKTTLFSRAKKMSTELNTVRRANSTKTAKSLIQMMMVMMASEATMAKKVRTIKMKMRSQKKCQLLQQRDKRSEKLESC